MLIELLSLLAIGMFITDKECGGEFLVWMIFINLLIELSDIVA